MAEEQHDTPELSQRELEQLETERYLEDRDLTREEVAEQLAAALPDRATRASREQGEAGS